MGQVYLARTPGGRQVVVKVILPELADDPEFRARFAREAEAARLVGGFHTAQVVDADPEADAPWIATAYIPAPTLESTVREHGPLNFSEVRSLAVGLAEGLEAIHHCGLVHRDLKPANILLADDGPRIIDFGIARPLGDTGVTRTGAFIGTLAYISPEQTRGLPVTPAGDVFSLGTVLTFAATGGNPFSADTPAAVVLKVITPTQAPAGLPPDLSEIISACWDPAPEERPTPAEIIGRLSPGSLPAGQNPLSSPHTDISDPSIDTLLNPTLLRTEQMTEKQALEKKEEEPDRLRAPYISGVPEFTASRRKHEETTDTVDDGAPRERPRRRLLTLAVCTLLFIGLVYRPFIGGWEPPPSRIEPALATGTLIEPREGAVGTRQGIEVMAISSDGTTLAAQDFYRSGSGFLRPSIDERYVRLWDVETGKIRTARKGAPGLGGGRFVSTLEGALLVIERNSDGTWLRDISTGDLLFSFDEEEQGKLKEVGFGTDMSVYASEGSDDRVHLWDVENGGLLSTLPEHDDPASVGPFSPDGSLLAVRQGNDLLLWDVRAGERTVTIPLGEERSSPPMFSPDGSTIAAGDENGTVRLWDTSSGEVLSTFIAYPHSLWRELIGRGSVDAIAFSPDGSMIAAGGESSKVHIWDVQAGTHVFTLTMAEGDTDQLFFALNGKSVVTSGAERTILRWDLPSDSRL